MEAFDQSFELFKDDFKSLDPWVETEKLPNAWTVESSSSSPDRSEAVAATKGLAWNASFESNGTSLFDFSTASLATPSAEVQQQASNNQQWPPQEDGKSTTDKSRREITVTVQEKLSTLYDQQNAADPCHIEGSITVKSAQVGPDDPVYLVLRDLQKQTNSVKGRDNICNDVTANASRENLKENDCVLQVAPMTSTATEDVVVARYVCNPKLKPVPMLIKSKVQTGDSVVRAGFKIRANPSNQHTLHNVIIVLAVPPIADATSVKMSRSGGIWDEMKRTIVWSVASLKPGDALETQLQFDLIDGATSAGCKFPVLVQCDYPAMYSSIDITNDYNNASGIPVNLHVERSGRVLHRKV